jgi:hypothetical protein
MIGGGEAGFDTKSVEEVDHDGGSKLGAAVTSKLKRKAVKTEDFAVINICNTFGRNIRSARKGVNKFRKMICKYYNGIIAVGRWKLCDEIDTDSIRKQGIFLVGL